MKPDQEPKFIILRDQFYQNAAAIDPNPRNRLSTKVKAALATNNFIFDMHCHVFDRKSMDLLYFITRMLDGGEGAEHSYLNYTLLDERLSAHVGDIEDLPYDSTFESEEISDNDIQSLEDDLDQQLERLDLVSTERDELRNKHRSVIQVLKSGNMRDIYKLFSANHGINLFTGKNENLISVVLGMDLNMGWQAGRAKIKKNQTEQNQELRNLSKEFSILPFFPIDPRRAFLEGEENLYNNFLKAFTGDNPFYGVKVYPALGYLPGDYRLDPIFKICAEKGIPVVTHCGGTIVSTGESGFYVYEDTKKIKVKHLRRKNRAEYLNEPRHWGIVLNKNPNLRLNIAHFGGAKKWFRDPTKRMHHRIKTIIDLMESYPNVYADFSFNIKKRKAVRNFFKLLDNSELVSKRALYGTDYWVVLFPLDIKSDQKFFVEQSGAHLEALTKNNCLNYLGIS